MAEFKEIKSNVNIRDIHSFYIIKKVFSYLNKKQTFLNMIIYNNELQKFLLVDIENYKKISGKY